MATRSDSNSETKKTTTENEGTMSVQEAGHMGGVATSKTHDKKFYEEIGSEGGSVSGGNFKNDPKRAAEAGSHSHDNDNKKSDKKND
jgi:general stress protein YciG